jgi:hypothetical protein
MAPCYANRYHPTKPACQNEAVWKSAGLNNLVDGWTWCAQHAPSRAFRERIASATPPEDHQP